MKQAVINWLNNPARRYDDGVILFEVIASEAYKDKYLNYFKRTADPNMLIAKIRALIPLIPAGIAPARLSTDVPTPISVSHSMPVSVTSTLAPDQTAIQSRIREIRPMQAAIHAEIHAENNDMIRRQKVSELLALESERKALWKRFDGEEDAPAVRPEEQEDPLERGARLMRRMKQLKQNLSRDKCSENRRKQYEAELKSIQSELNLT